VVVVNQCVMEVKKMPKGKWPPRLHSPTVHMTWKERVDKSTVLQGSRGENNKVARETTDHPILENHLNVGEVDPGS